VANLEAMLECDGLLFDLDGVLADSWPAVMRCWTRWCVENELDVEKSLAQIHGKRTVDLVKLLAPHLELQAQLAKITAYEVAETEGVTALPGARELLACLPEDAWTVVTSAPRVVALSRLHACGLPVPSRLVAAEDVTRGKPDPEAYRAGATRLELDPARCVVVEDSPEGIQAAQAAGARVVALLTTHAAEEMPAVEWTVPNLEALRVVAGEGARLRLVRAAGA
jgi:sugar-phosphatase